MNLVRIDPAKPGLKIFGPRFKLNQCMARLSLFILIFFFLVWYLIRKQSQAAVKHQQILNRIFCSVIKIWTGPKFPESSNQLSMIACSQRWCDFSHPYNNKFWQVDRKTDKINGTSVIGDKKWHNVDKLFLVNYMPHALGMHKIYSLAYFFLSWTVSSKSLFLIG